jgi:ornithine cyclodeaminase
VPSFETRDLPFLDRARLLSAVDFSAAADALDAALRGGFDPEAEPDRSSFSVGRGELLIMPAEYGRFATVKLATIGGTPRVQGVAVIFDAVTLAPVALVDGVALTELRTPAVSLLAARRMVHGPIGHLVVIGRGTQGVAHLEALRAEYEIGTVTVLHSESDPAGAAAAIADADVICCATTAREPLFDGGLVGDRTLVISIGSHEPDARELDTPLVQRAAIVVESRRSALREAGDLVLADIAADDVITLGELLRGGSVPDDRPRLFKSTGMSWEDAVIIDLALDAEGTLPTAPVG